MRGVVESSALGHAGRGGMPEWMNGPVLKTGDSVSGSEGSNPSPAATKCQGWG